MSIIVAAALGADLDGEPVFLPALGNEITKSHDGHLLFWLEEARPAGPLETAPADLLNRDQAASRTSSLGASI